MVDLIDYVKYYQDILDFDWCEHLIYEFKKSNKMIKLNSWGWESHGIDRENDLKHLYEPVIDCFIEAKDLYLKDVDINHPNKDFTYFVEWGNKCRIQHLETGGHMPTHVDNTVTQVPKKKYPNGLHFGSESADSKLSLVLHLNDDYEGGNFHINDKDYSTKKGSVMVFPSAFMFQHGVKEVTKGERWSISIFMR
jgi:hypothetical protein|tara:strand:- start:334 stop:915 length:582 start_codon:yes stop_codon:yes gene_type:complete